MHVVQGCMLKSAGDRTETQLEGNFLYEMTRH